MKRTRFVPIAIAVLAAALLAGCSTTGGTAATVNGVKYSQRDFQDELRAQRDNATYWNASQQGATGATGEHSVPAQLSADWLTRHIYTQIVADSPAGRNAKPDAALKAQVEAKLSQTPGWKQFPAWFRTQLIDSNATAIAAQDAVTGSSAQPSDADLRAFFDKYSSQICKSGKVVSHILVKTQAEAAAIAAQLKGGADFAELAKKFSEDDSNAKNGGDLDYFGRGRMVPEFDTAAFTMEPGQISELIKSRIQGLEASADVRNQGTVISVTDGIVRVHGLSDAMQGEMLEFPANAAGVPTYGLALNLEEDNVGVVLLGERLTPARMVAVGLAAERGTPAAIAACAKARALAAAGRPAEAVEVLDSVLGRKPELVEAHLSRGAALLLLNKPAVARVDFGFALKENPNFARALLGMGRAYRAENNDADAQHHFEKVMQLTPTNSIFHRAAKAQLDAMRQK